MASDMGKQRDKATGDAKLAKASRPARRSRQSKTKKKERRVHREALDVYLNDLAASGPLSREQEVRLALRIEEAQENAFRAVLDSGVALVELDAWRQAVADGSMLVPNLSGARKGEGVEDAVVMQCLQDAVEAEEARASAAKRWRATTSKPRREASARARVAAVTRRNEALDGMELGRSHRSALIERVAEAMRAIVLARAELAEAAVERDSEQDAQETQETIDAIAETLDLSEGEVVEAWRPLRRALRKSERAKAELTSANLRLVVSFAKRFINRGVPLDDLIQEGNIGLMRAVDKFDHRVGTKFSTYASWWLRQAMQRAIVNQGRTVRLPVHVAASKSSTSRMRQRLAGELGRPPELEELAERMGTKVERVRQVLDAGAESIPFDVPVGDEGGLSLSEVLKDLSATEPEQEVADDIRRQRAREMLRTLTAREQLILNMRFGIGHYDPHTLAEIGRHLGLTRERIRQIEMRALEKLRRVVERFVGPEGPS